MALNSSSSVAPSSPPAAAVSPWRSPVPYLFGGLAAMMALIALALFILACSYRNLSRSLQNDDDDAASAGDLEAGDAKPSDDDDSKTPARGFEERHLVIMAGEEKPTFLATPTPARPTSFSCRCSEPADEVEISSGGDGGLHRRSDEGVL